MSTTNISDITEEEITTVIETRIRRTSNRHWEIIDFSESKCPICQEEYKSGEKQINLKKCNHNFHEECFTNYEMSLEFYDNLRCPICREEIPKMHQVTLTRSPSTTDLRYQHSGGGARMSSEEYSRERDGFNLGRRERIYNTSSGPRIDPIDERIDFRNMQDRLNEDEFGLELGRLSLSSPRLSPTLIQSNIYTSPLSSPYGISSLTPPVLIDPSYMPPSTPSTYSSQIPNYVEETRTFTRRYHNPSDPVILNTYLPSERAPDAVRFHTNITRGRRHFPQPRSNVYF